MRAAIDIAVITLVASLLTACSSSPSIPSAGVREGDPAFLNRECKLLGTVNGRSMFGGLSDEAKTQAAMNDAREKAAKMGATHVIFMASDTSGVLNSGHAAVRAYRCDKPS